MVGSSRCHAHWPEVAFGLSLRAMSGRHDSAFRLLGLVAAGRRPHSWPMTIRSPAAERRVPGWALVFMGLVAMFGVTVLSEHVTRNPRLLPALIAMGAFAVPVSFVALVRDLLPGAGVPLHAVVTCFVFGGVVGTAAASVLEYDALRNFEVLPSLLVGALEEPAKLLLPLIVFAAGRHRRTADGLVLGVAGGMGFAAFETMGYALGALIAPHGTVGASEDVLLLRGALAPTGHAAWTGFVCAALWWARSQDRTARALSVALGAFAAAVLLHGGWDGFETWEAQAVIGTTSLILLTAWLVMARRELRAGDLRAQAA
jgi:RsiW-degrading membrane proteinase PrsW (M82 family)